MKASGLEDLGEMAFGVDNVTSDGVQFSKPGTDRIVLRDVNGNAIGHIPTAEEYRSLQADPQLLRIDQPSVGRLKPERRKIGEFEAHVGKAGFLEIERSWTVLEVQIDAPFDNFSPGGKLPKWLLKWLPKQTPSKIPRKLPNTAVRVQVYEQRYTGQNLSGQRR